MLTWSSWSGIAISVGLAGSVVAGCGTHEESVSRRSPATAPGVEAQVSAEGASGLTGDGPIVSIARVNDGAEALLPVNGKFRVTQSQAAASPTTVLYSLAG